MSKICIHRLLKAKKLSALFLTGHAFRWAFSVPSPQKKILQKGKVAVDAFVERLP